MKTLAQYIKEAAEETTAPSSKTFNFNFADLEGADDTIKSLQDMSADGVTIEVDDKKVKVTVSKDSLDAGQKVFELLQDFVHARRNDQKVASDESYAQKVKKFEETVASFFNYADDAATEEEEQKEADKAEEDKEKKEEE